MIDQNSVTYPILMMGTSFISIITTPEELTRCSGSALKGSTYERSQFIDSKGLRLKVLAIRNRRYVPPCWGIRLMRGRQVTVDLEFSRVDSITLPELIAILRKSVTNTHWTASQDFFDEVANEATSIAELLTRLSR